MVMTPVDPTETFLARLIDDHHPRLYRLALRAPKNPTSWRTPSCPRNPPAPPCCSGPLVWLSLVGTSKLNGGNDALLALVTAIP